MYGQNIGVLEWARSDIADKISDALSIKEIINVLQQVFIGTAAPIPESEYGLKVRGKKARENLNEACKEVLARVNSLGKTSLGELSPEDKEILLKHSGRGGLTKIHSLNITHHPMLQRAYGMP